MKEECNKQLWIKN